jgi:hypothetical protein
LSHAAIHIDARAAGEASNAPNIEHAGQRCSGLAFPWPKAGERPHDDDGVDVTLSQMGAHDRERGCGLAGAWHREVCCIHGAKGMEQPLSLVGKEWSRVLVPSDLLQGAQHVGLFELCSVVAVTEAQVRAGGISCTSKAANPFDLVFQGQIGVLSARCDGVAPPVELASDADDQVAA